MARKPRLFYPGAVYHVFLRGNAGQDIFFEKRDREYFCRLLQEGRSKLGHRIHAFSLMDTHVHLALQVAEIPLSRIMQSLSQRYTGWINRRQKRKGHLFQGRYKAILIDADAYLLELVRYIHLNPIRAGLVERVENYPWSSYWTYVGKEKLQWLSMDWVLAQFSSRENMARKRFKEFMREGDGEGSREEFHRETREGRILGNDTFFEEVLRRKGEKIPSQATLDQVLEKVSHSYGIDEESLTSGGREHRLSEPRAMIRWIVRETEHLSLTELSKRLKRDLSTLSVSAQRLAEKSQLDKHLAGKMEELRAALKS
jgi:putative transposase